MFLIIAGEEVVVIVVVDVGPCSKSCAQVTPSHVSKMSTICKCYLCIIRNFKVVYKKRLVKCSFYVSFVSAHDVFYDEV